MIVLSFLDFVSAKQAVRFFALLAFEYSIFLVQQLVIPVKLKVAVDGGAGYLLVIIIQIPQGAEIELLVMPVDTAGEHVLEDLFLARFHGAVKMLSFGVVLNVFSEA